MRYKEYYYNTISPTIGFYIMDKDQKKYFHHDGKLYGGAGNDGYWKTEDDVKIFLDLLDIVSKLDMMFDEEEFKI